MISVQYFHQKHLGASPAAGCYSNTYNNKCTFYKLEKSVSMLNVDRTLSTSIPNSEPNRMTAILYLKSAGAWLRIAGYFQYGPEYDFHRGYLMQLQRRQRHTRCTCKKHGLWQLEAFNDGKCILVLCSSKWWLVWLTFSCDHCNNDFCWSRSDIRHLLIARVFRCIVSKKRK